MGGFPTGRDGADVIRGNRHPSLKNRLLFMIAKTEWTILGTAIRYERPEPNRRGEENAEPQAHKAGT
jgi:hypothetical protein